MKFIDILLNVVKTAENSNDQNPDEFSDSVGMAEVVDWPIFNRHVTGYWVTKHLCTDTWVGLQAIYLDGELIGTSNQQYRKASIDIHYLNEACAEKMRQFIINNISNEDRYVPIHNVETLEQELDLLEGYSVEYACQLLSKVGYYKGKSVVVLGNGDPWRGILSDLVRVQFQNDEDKAVDPLLIECIEFPNTYIINVQDFRIPFNIESTNNV